MFGGSTGKFIATLVLVLAYAPLVHARWSIELHTERVNAPRDTGTVPDASVSLPVLSDDGRFALFSSAAFDLGPEISVGRSFRLYLLDRATGTLTNLERNRTPFFELGPTVAIAGDASLVAFSDGGAGLAERVYLQDPRTGDIRELAPDANNILTNPGLSRTGRFVAFASNATNLVARDPNGGTRDVFVADLQLGTIELITLAGNGRSDLPQLRGNGRFVLFRSEASNLVPGDDNSLADWFVHDRNSGVTQRLPFEPGPGLRFRNSVDLSDDGSFAVATPSADVVLYDRQTEAFTTVTAGGDGPSFTPRISRDGGTVVFSSRANNLTPDDLDPRANIFSYDRASRRLTLVETEPALEDRLSLVASGDARTVVFSRLERPLQPSPGLFSEVPYLVGVPDGATTQMAPRNPDLRFVWGGNGGSSFPSLSDDGGVLGFLSGANNLALDPVRGGQRAVAFLSDLAAGVSVRSGDEEGFSSAPRLSANGALLTFSAFSRTASGDRTPKQVYTIDATGTIEAVTNSADGDSSGPCISGDGRYVAFVSRADDLVPTGGDPLLEDYFVADRIAGTVRRITRTLQGVRAERPAPLSDPACDLDAAGRWLLFASSSDELNAPGTANTFQIYAADLDGDEVRILTPAGDAHSLSPVVSGDGRWVFFRSQATNLTADRAEGAYGIFAYDLQAGALARLPLPPMAWAGAPDTTPDGRFLVLPATFGSATDLTDSRPGLANIYRYDRQTGALEQITDGDFPSTQASINAAGDRVAFASSALNLVPKCTFNLDILIAQRAPAPANRPPVAEPQSLSTAAGTPLTITLQGADPDGDPLQYRILTDPESGLLDADGAPVVVYTPQPGFSGRDRFTFGVSDGPAEAVATVTIAVGEVSSLACFEPVLQGDDRGTFLWSECDGSGRWHLQVRGGGTRSPLVYEGALTGNLSAVNGVSLEGPDRLLTAADELGTIV
ncbi:MAG: Ig-like domain-containing protein, partial [Pseudomonadota bacterium]